MATFLVASWLPSQSCHSGQAYRASSLVGFLFRAMPLVLVILCLCPWANAVPVRGPRALQTDEESFSKSVPRSVTLPLGQVHGMPCAEYPTVTQFLGIPYAAPMLGGLRFQPPRPYDQPYPKAGLDATTMPAPCGSYCGQGAGAGEDTSLSSEDCLFLNVWSPPSAARAGGALVPVRVYIHGGSITGCSASDPQWDGCASAAKANVVHVNIQFRKGVFGMLAHAATMAESNTTGNWALLDQQLALRWVQQHVHLFGGDPARVLLNGHSSGGQSVDFHMVVPSSSGLFHAAISQSPPCSHFLTLEQSYLVSQQFIFRAGCGPRPGNPEQELECLRAKPWDFLMALTRTMGAERPRDILMCDRANWMPFFHHVVDGTVVPYQMVDALRQGKFNQVPYMTGVTTAEASTFIETLYDDEVTGGALPQLISEVYPGADPEPILAQYPEYLYRDAVQPIKARLTALWTDIFFTCPVHERLEARLAQDLISIRVPTYLYLWAATPSCPSDRAYLGPSHAVDLWFTFGTVTNIPDQSAPSGICNYTAVEVELSDTTLAAYEAMANGGTPRWANGTTWVTWQPKTQLGTFLDIGYVDSRRIDFKSRCTVLVQATQQRQDSGR